LDVEHLVRFYLRLALASVEAKAMLKGKSNFGGVSPVYVEIPVGCEVVPNTENVPHVLNLFNVEH